MSSLTTLARPYAKAAFALAHDAGGLGQWQSMLNLASELAANPQVADLLDNPLVSADQALGLLTQAGGENFEDRFKAFLGVLADNRRLPLLPEITALYTRLKAEAEKRLQVRVVSAVPLNEDQASRMRAALTKRFERDIELDTEIDPAVLGGAVVYAGDEVIDGSLRGRLNKLSNALAP